MPDENDASSSAGVKSDGNELGSFTSSDVTTTIGKSNGPGGGPG